MIALVYVKISQEMQGHARFITVNTKDEQDLAAKYDIRSFPTLVVFEAGCEVALHSQGDGGRIDYAF